MPSSLPQPSWLWHRPPVDPVEQTMRELARQGTTMARVAHLFATLMVVLFSLGSLVALSGDAFSAVITTLQHGGVPSIPEAISIAVSTLMVVCCDIGLVYAAMTLRVLRIRGSDEGRLLHLAVLIGVSVIEASTYFYMSLLYEHPSGWGLFLVVARALTAPLLSVYLSMARAHRVTSRDILHQAELAQGIQLVRDVALAWAIRALVLHVPAQEKGASEPPPKPRLPSRRLSRAQRAVYAGKPSWNGKPKRGWDGPNLPPAGTRGQEAGDALRLSADAY
jgi:hypothetical protein